MVVCNPKGGRTVAPAFLAMLLMIMMLLNAYCCSAAVLAKSNTSFRCSDGRFDACLIEEDLELELELGFLMNPYVSRTLAKAYPEYPNSETRGQPAFSKPCGNSGDYDQCIHKIKSGQNNSCPKKSTYDRCDKSGPK